MLARFMRSADCGFASRLVNFSPHGYITPAGDHQRVGVGLLPLALGHTLYNNAALRRNECNIGQSGRHPRSDRRCGHFGHRAAAMKFPASGLASQITLVGILLVL